MGFNTLLLDHEFSQMLDGNWKWLDREHRLAREENPLGVGREDFSISAEMSRELMERVKSANLAYIEEIRRR